MSVVEVEMHVLRRPEVDAELGQCRLERRQHAVGGIQRIELGGAEETRDVPRPRVVLIAGGRDKHGDYAPLADELAAKGRGVVLIGEAADRIAKALEGKVDAARAGSMDEAVALASKLAKSGDAVLLSPACSSFDMFRDYKHRGDEFVRAVRSLADKEKRA